MIGAVRYENNPEVLSIEMAQERPENLIALKKNTFHESIKFLIRVAQIFGVMPLHNINKNWENVYFKWRSWRVLFSLINAISTLVSAIFWLITFCVYGVVVDHTAHMAFYICTFLSTIHFINIARVWPDILKEWSLIEIAMRSYGDDINLKRKYLLMTSTSFLLGTIEHALFVVNAVYQSEACKSYSISHFRAAFEVMFNNFFSFISFNAWIGILVKIINVLATFSWIYTDLFISLLSVAITAKFRQIVKRLETNKVMHQKFWREIRQDYQKLYLLSKKIDKHISFLVLISYMHNIFFLCIQLYNSLRQRIGLVETTYFVYSFTFLVMRIIAVSMYGAWLHDEAKKPIEFLYTVPTEFYCTEIGRLIEQIYVTPVGITGSGFFIVTRNFLLQMAGTIVTFELMLFQFAPIDSKNKVYNRTEACI